MEKVAQFGSESVAQITAECLAQFAPEWVAHFAAESVAGFLRNTHLRYFQTFVLVRRFKIFVYLDKDVFRIECCPFRLLCTPFPYSF